MSSKASVPAAVPQESIPDGYVLVRRQGTEQKEPPGEVKNDIRKFPVCTVPPRLGSLSKTHIAVRGKGANRSLITTIARDLGTGSSSANTAYTTVYILQPGSCTEFANFAAIFDECRCVAIKAHIFVGASTGASGAGPPNVWAVAYDPANSNAYSAMEVLLSAQQRTGLQLACDGTGSPGPVGTSILPTTRTGGVVLKVKVPSLVVENMGASTPTDLVGNGWFAMTSGTPANAVVGYLKPLIEAIGSAGVTTIRMLVEYTMEFRSRT